MTEQPLISILMPAYNAERFVGAAIQSVIDQSYPNWELLVLDDGSSDGTSKIIQSYDDPRIRTFQHGKNEGYLKSCNKLFGYANGDFITFQDADDLQYANRLSVCINAFSENLSLDFVTTNHERIDASGQLIRVEQSDVDYQRMSADVGYQAYFACATLMFKSNLLKSVPGYHPFFDGIGGEDYHMIWIFSRAFKGKHLTKSLYKYRTHDKQNQFTSSNSLKFFMSMILKDIRIKTTAGQDPLRNIDSYRYYWHDFADRNDSHITLGISHQLLQQGKKAQSILTAIKALVQNPVCFVGWKTSYSICRKAIFT